MKTVAFVPIRLNSKRVVGKNLKELGNKPLMTYVLHSLSEISEIDEIYVYCSSEEVIGYLPPNVRFLKRSEHLDRDEALGCEIYDAFISEVYADVYILAHATSPFIKPESIKNALGKVLHEGYDSAFSAEKIQTFCWYEGKPLNYNLKSIPRTQTIQPVIIESSAFYIFKRDVWRVERQRIGFHPYIQIVDKIEGIDIDHPEEFDYAEKIIRINRL